MSRSTHVYLYGRRWNSFSRRPIGEITQEQAAERWVTGPAFSVSRLREGAWVPDWTLVVRPGGDYLKVCRYDEHGSTVEVRHFSDEGGGDRLFLAQLTTYVYPEEAVRVQDFADAVAHKIWNFWPDGRARRRETITSQPQARVTQYRDVDVSALWVPAPTYGDWDRWGDMPDPQPAPPTTT